MITALDIAKRYAENVLKINRIILVAILAVFLPTLAHLTFKNAFRI